MYTFPASRIDDERDRGNYSKGEKIPQHEMIGKSLFQKLVGKLKWECVCVKLGELTVKDR